MDGKPSPEYFFVHFEFFPFSSLPGAIEKINIPVKCQTKKSEEKKKEHRWERERDAVRLLATQAASYHRSRQAWAVGQPSAKRNAELVMFPQTNNTRPPTEARNLPDRR